MKNKKILSAVLAGMFLFIGGFSMKPAYIQASAAETTLSCTRGSVSENTVSSAKGYVLRGTESEITLSSLRCSTQYRDSKSPARGRHA